MEENKIVIYQTDDGQTQIDVRLENETVWLTQKQIAELFGTKRPAITKHLKNIYSSEELDENSTCSILEHMGNEGKQTYSTKYYNLDAILSVGYRVNSKNATRFRQWANKVLKSFLVKGYAVNQRIHSEQIAELRQLVGMLGRTIQSQPVLSTDETSALFEVVTDYSYALDTLDNYDYQRLTIEKTTKEEPFHATYENAMGEINRLREKFGGSVLLWLRALWQREGRLVQEQHRADISDLWRQGTLSQRRGESGHAALPGHEEPFVQRRQQTHCRHALPVVPQRQPHPLSCRRFKAYSRQHPRCPHPDDCREPHRGKRRHGESGCKFD